MTAIEQASAQATRARFSRLIELIRRDGNALTVKTRSVFAGTISQQFLDKLGSLNQQEMEWYCNWIKDAYSV